MQTWQNRRGNKGVSWPREGGDWIRGENYEKELSNHECKKKKKDWLWDGTVQPTQTHGCETWAWDRADSSRIRLLK